eukprot:8936413-Heterocapsa_arctica.AAC.1
MSSISLTERPNRTLSRHPTICSSVSGLRPSHNPWTHRRSSLGWTNASGSRTITGVANGWMGEA